MVAIVCQDAGEYRLRRNTEEVRDSWEGERVRVEEGGRGKTEGEGK